MVQSKAHLNKKEKKKRKEDELALVTFCDFNPNKNFTNISNGTLFIK